MCSVKVVSDHALSEARLLKFAPGASRAHAKVHCYETSALSLFYGEATFPVRGALELHCEGWRKARRLAVWRLITGEGYRVSEVVEFLADWYFVQTHRRAGYAFMRHLPAGVENGLDVGDVTLLEAQWALDKCVLVGG
jgi:hypothetical protein